MTDADYIDIKTGLVERFVAESGAKEIWDFGANDGKFSRVAARSGTYVVSMDSDHACVSNNYADAKTEGLQNVLPLLVDLSNPTPSLGWGSVERASLVDRGPADLGLALALVHHLAIGNNVPLEQIAAFFARVCRDLIIEFVPKSDPRVKELLAGREDIFDNYDGPGFETAFAAHFEITERREIGSSGRVLYYMSGRLRS
jgi:ribosomal protein L11 methylase PrmA